MKKLLFYALILLIVTGGCSKKNTPRPNVEPQQPAGMNPIRTDGSISGKLTTAPGPGIFLVVSTFPSGEKVIVDGHVAADGAFYFPGLPAGNYSLALSTNNRYLPLENKAIKVITGNQTDAGTIILMPNPENGNIVGMISPYRAASTCLVQCMEPYSTNSYPGVIDPATGKFEIKNLPPGKWLLYFQPNNGFKAPLGAYVVISTRQTADLGFINFEPAPVVSLLSLTANGKSLRMDGNATYDGTKFVLAGRYVRGVMNSIGDGSYSLTISLDKLGTTGSYVCNANSTSKITYSQRLYGLGISNDTWTRLGKDANGTVVVKNIDLVNKTITGTFQASLVASNSPKMGIQQLTNGSFTAMYN